MTQQKSKQKQGFSVKNLTITRNLTTLVLGLGAALSSRRHRLDLEKQLLVAIIRISCKTRLPWRLAPLGGRQSDLT